MPILNIGKIFQVVQVKNSPPKYMIRKAKGYEKIGAAKTFMTKWHEHAKRSQRSMIMRKDLSHPDYLYWTETNPWLDLNNFEIVEYELVKKTSHKHPLAK